MKEKPTYYDGTKLLSMKDINGNTPEIFMCTGNRTGGKTTYFNRLCVNKFLKEHSEFMLLYRFKYEVKNAGEAFFNDIHNLFFKDYYIKTKPWVQGSFYEVLIGPNDDSWEAQTCGWAVPLSAADNVKKYSHLFSNVGRMLMDEFQSETNHYATDEVKNLRSIHTSVARGNFKQVRYVPVYMLSNAVSMLNPYYTAFKISHRLNKDTKFLKGVGWVLEQAYVESAARAQQESAFNKAFADDHYNQYMQQNIYLNDNMTFIEKVNGKGDYIATLKYRDKYYGLRIFWDDMICYCDNRPDMYYPTKIAISAEDHNATFLIMQRNNEILMKLRLFFDLGKMRFKNLECKECIMQAIGY